MYAPERTQSVTYERFCTICGKANSETEVTRCAQCHIHAFCKSHASKQHPCESTDKTIGRGIEDLTLHIKAFQQSGHKPNGSIVQIDCESHEVKDTNLPLLEEQLNKGNGKKLYETLCKIHKCVQENNTILLIITKNSSTAPCNTTFCLLKPFEKRDQYDSEAQTGQLKDTASATDPIEVSSIPTQTDKGVDASSNTTPTNIQSEGIQTENPIDGERAPTLKVVFRPIDPAHA